MPAGCNAVLNSLCHLLLSSQIRNPMDWMPSGCFLDDAISDWNWGRGSCLQPYNKYKSYL
jgi:hypothetical protein